MIMKKVSGWKVLFSQTNSEIVITINHKDGSLISDTDTEIGETNVLGYRLTSQAIEDDYIANGDTHAVHISDDIAIGNWHVNIINDCDNHLNLYCRNTSFGVLEEVSLINGPNHSNGCEITLSIIVL
jgi:hypothetical protein